MRDNWYQNNVKTNRLLHLAVHVYSDNAKVTSKRGKNISHAIRLRLLTYFFVLTTFWRHLALSQYTRIYLLTKITDWIHQDPSPFHFPLARADVYKELIYTGLGVIRWLWYVIFLARKHKKLFFIGWEYPMTVIRRRHATTCQIFHLSYYMTELKNIFCFHTRRFWYWWFCSNADERLKLP